MPEDRWQIVFNPSFPSRLVHMVLAAYLTAELVVSGTGGLHLLRDSSDRAARRMFSMAMWMLVVVAPIRIPAGDAHGLNTPDHQPAKIMTTERHSEAPPTTPC